MACLQSDEPREVRAAARAAMFSDPSMYAGVCEWLWGHGDLHVRAAAVMMGLSLGLPQAWQRVRAAALEGGDTARFTALYAALGGRSEHAELESRLARAKDPRPWLRALGHSRNAGVVPALLPYLEADEPAEKKLAFEAIGLIVGIDLHGDAFASEPSAATDPRELPPVERDPEAREALPPLSEDDLDADLALDAETALPMPEVSAVRAFWEERKSRFQADSLYLWGRAEDPAGLAHFLERGPMRNRHVVATAVALRSGGLVRVDTCALSSIQLRQLRALSKVGRAVDARRFADW